MSEKRTKEDWDAAAAVATTQLEELRQDETLRPGIEELMKFHRAYFMEAGHKRLGRLYVREAKKLITS